MKNTIRESLIEEQYQIEIEHRKRIRELEYQEALAKLQSAQLVAETNRVNLALSCLEADKHVTGFPFIEQACNALSKHTIEWDRQDTDPSQQEPKSE